MKISYVLGAVLALSGVPEKVDLRGYNFTVSFIRKFSEVFAF